MNPLAQPSTKILSLKDDPILSDLIGRSNPSEKNNFIVIRDAATGAVLMTRKNLVVRKGREFNLRKIFDIPYDGETQTILDQRSINLFAIGSGGVPVADPFNPLAPTPADINMSKEVPFRVIPSGESLPVEDVAKYHDARTVGGNTSYYKKTYSSKAIVTDDANDDYYVKLTLDVTEKDARDAIISELGLYSAVKNGAQFTDPRIATRVTFQSEALSQATNKALVIEYYVYA